MHHPTLKTASEQVFTQRRAQRESPRNNRFSCDLLSLQALEKALSEVTKEHFTGNKKEAIDKLFTSNKKEAIDKMLKTIAIFKAPGR